jgi:hypothetical protein
MCWLDCQHGKESMSESTTINKMIAQGVNENERISIAEHYAGAEAKLNHRFNLKAWIYSLPWIKKRLAIWILRPWFNEQTRQQINPKLGTTPMTWLWNECEIDEAI